MSTQRFAVKLPQPSALPSRAHFLHNSGIQVHNSRHFRQGRDNFPPPEFGIVAAHLVSIPAPLPPVPSIPPVCVLYGKIFIPPSPPSPPNFRILPHFI